MINFGPMILAMWGNGMWYGDKTWLCHYVIHNIGKGWEGNETIRLHDIYWILMRMKRDWNLDLIPMTQYQSQQFVKLKMIWYNYRISTTAVVNLIIAGIYCTYKDLAYLFDFHEIHTHTHNSGFLGIFMYSIYGQCIVIWLLEMTVLTNKTCGSDQHLLRFWQILRNKAGELPKRTGFFLPSKSPKSFF